MKNFISKIKISYVLYVICLYKKLKEKRIIKLVFYQTVTKVKYIASVFKIVLYYRKI